MKVYSNLYSKVISVENLFQAWAEFRSDKQSKPDVMRFERNLEENLFALYHLLRTKQYKHGNYQAFYIHDPKQRLIHKATVQDRVLHHAIFKVLNPIFEPTFIAHSFSCRVGKGTHKGVTALAGMLRKVSKNNTKPCFALKCDVRKFFASVDQDILFGILQKRIQDEDMMSLLNKIVYSFKKEANPYKGLPIGNLTSQLFANIYMNELDQFVKHQLRVEYYVRYTDDFIIVSDNTDYLQALLPKIRQFLNDTLLLELHPNKISIRKFRQGIDFLGYVVLPHYSVLRTKTKRRILSKLDNNIQCLKSGAVSEGYFHQSLQSYLGVLFHANSYNVEQNIKNKVWFELSTEEIDLLL
ncbi:MAG: reverse transcriptase/maturase family protein [Candidatus Saccharibacteria bacterium]